MSEVDQVRMELVATFFAPVGALMGVGMLQKAVGRTTFLFPRRRRSFFRSFARGIVRSVHRYAAEIIVNAMPLHLRRAGNRVVAGKPRGFTLIEILVVIVIIAILASLVAPSIFQNVGAAKDATARSQIEMLGAALDAYRLDNGKYPPIALGLEALNTKGTDESASNWRGPYLRKAIPLDPWHHPYMELVRRPENELLPIIRRAYGIDPHTAQEMIAGLAPDTSPAAAGEIPLDDLVHLANEAPVVKLVNLLVLEALDARASDVHLEAYANGLRVRYRIDGVLQEAPSPPAHLSAAVISRLKIMAELDIAERRLPQDGRIRLRLQDRQVDVRVSTLPTLMGESVVLRLLDKEHGRIALTDLGMAPDTLVQFSQVIGRPHGIVLWPLGQREAARRRPCTPRST